MPTTTNYIWDDQNYLAESDATNTINVVYTNEPERYGNLVSSRISGTTSYHHFDAAGSTRQLTNSAGGTTDTAIYDAWGKLVTRSGVTAVPFLWTGELECYFDAETGLDYIRQRIYGPAIGRWTAFDIADLIANMNRFAYAINRPVDRSDPSGLFVAAPPYRCPGPPPGGDGSGSMVLITELDPCTSLTEWTLEDCKQEPPCPMSNTELGQGPLNQGAVPDILDFLGNLPDAKRVQPWCKPNIVVQKVCIPGKGNDKGAITCPPRLSRNGQNVIVDICIPDSLTYAEAVVLIAHEMTHFVALCNLVKRQEQGFGLPDSPQIHAGEKAAYEVQCELMWKVACGPQLGKVNGKNHAKFVDDCVQAGLKFSAPQGKRAQAANQELFQQACQDFVNGLNKAQ